MPQRWPTLERPVRSCRTGGMRKLAVVLLAAFAVLFLGACGSSGSGSHTTSSSSTTGSAPGGANPTIIISSFAYSGDLTVQPGAKVTVINKDSVAHTLTD